MQIIINADDLGYSDEINDAIFSLMSKRRVTSATIIANGPGFQDMISKIRNFKSCSFGVHLNLTEFRSLTNHRIFYNSGIVNESGIFDGALRKISPNFKLLDAVEEEWAVQIEKVLDAGIPVSHLDSHHHVHTIPWLFLSLKNIQRRFGIRKVRTTMNLYDEQVYPPLPILLIKKKIWNWALKNIYDTKTTNYFTSFQWFISSMLKIGKMERTGIAELMCHPGHHWSRQETALIWSDWNSKVSCELLSYNDFH